MNKLIVLVLTISGLIFSNPILAEGKGEGRKGKRLERMIERLNLNSEQVDKLKAFQVKARANKKKRESMKSLRKEMMDAFINNVSDEKLKSIHQRIQNLRTQRTQKKFEKMLFLKSILKKEQREKFVKMRMSRRKGNGRWKKRNK